MSEHPQFDPAKGFVALPVEVMDLDLSPGAFRLLVELCRMANRDGVCWPSLGQLSDRLGRSKSAISGYLTDLREAELVDTVTQTTANGYNYRLKYRVTFWSTWRATLSTPVKTERRVQPDERMCETQNHKPKNHTPGGVVTDFSGLAFAWASVFRGAPYPSAATAPDPTLIAATKAALAKTPPTISADITTLLTTFWASKFVPVPAKALAEQRDHLAKLQLSPAESARLFVHLDTAWKPHWRRPPTPDQFNSLVAAADLKPQSQVHKLLEGYLRRWEMAQRQPSGSSALMPHRKAWSSAATAGNVAKNISVDIDNGIRAV